MDWSRVLILSGPSGVGKDTILARWRASDPRIAQAIACTTRAPRPGELDEVDYKFVCPADFDAMHARGEFLEAKNVHGNWYATRLSELERITRAGQWPVLKIDVQGALDVIAAHPEVLSIFLLPPSTEELTRRLRARASDSEAEIARRLEDALHELAQACHYRHRVVNDDPDRAVAELMELLNP